MRLSGAAVIVVAVDAAVFLNGIRMGLLILIGQAGRTAGAEMTSLQWPFIALSSFVV